jgi:hypothetical protein
VLTYQEVANIPLLMERIERFAEKTASRLTCSGERSSNTFR